MPLHLLLAAPEDSVLISYRDYLIGEGFKVALARSGLECLAELRKAPPDVLVLELNLPWGGGDGIISLMQEDPSLPQVKATFLVSWLGRQPPREPTALHVSEYSGSAIPPPLLAMKIRQLVRKCSTDRKYWAFSD